MLLLCCCLELPVLGTDTFHLLASLLLAIAPHLRGWSQRDEAHGPWEEPRDAFLAGPRRLTTSGLHVPPLTIIIKGKQSICWDVMSDEARAVFSATTLTKEFCGCQKAEVEPQIYPQKDHWYFPTLHRSKKNVCRRLGLQQTAEKFFCSTAWVPEC